MLKDDFLYYFRSPNDTNPAGVIPLEGGVVQRSAAHEPGDQFVWEIASPYRIYWVRLAVLESRRNRLTGSSAS